MKANMSSKADILRKGRDSLHKKRKNFFSKENHKEL